MYEDLVAARDDPRCELQIQLQTSLRIDWTIVPHKNPLASEITYSSLSQERR